MTQVPTHLAQAYTTYIQAMNEFAEQQGVHGWEAHISAAEGGPKHLHGIRESLLLINIRDYKQWGEGDYTSCEYTVEEAAMVCINDGGGSITWLDNDGKVIDDDK